MNTLGSWVAVAAVFAAWFVGPGNVLLWLSLATLRLHYALEKGGREFNRYQQRAGAAISERLVRAQEGQS